MQAMPWPLANIPDHVPLTAGYVAGTHYHILSAYGVQEGAFQPDVLQAAPGLIPPSMGVYALFFKDGP